MNTSYLIICVNILSNFICEILQWVESRSQMKDPSSLELFTFARWLEMLVINKSAVWPSPNYCKKAITD